MAELPDSVDYLGQKKWTKLGIIHIKRLYSLGIMNVTVSWQMSLKHPYQLCPFEATEQSEEVKHPCPIVIMTFGFSWSEWTGGPTSVVILGHTFSMSKEHTVLPIIRQWS